MLRDRDRGVVAGREHQAVQKIDHRERFTRFQTHSGIAVAQIASLFADLDRFVEFTVFQSKDTGHDLCRACGITPYVGIAFDPEDRVCRVFDVDQKYSVLCQRFEVESCRFVCFGCSVKRDQQKTHKQAEDDSFHKGSLLPVIVLRGLAGTLTRSFARGGAFPAFCFGAHIQNEHDHADDQQSEYDGEHDGKPFHIGGQTAAAVRFRDRIQVVGIHARHIRIADQLT